MSLIPRTTSNNLTPFTPFPQHFWDNFFTQDLWFEPFRDLPFPFRSSFPNRTVPYSELAIETSGNVSARLECKELPEAHLIVADLPGIDKDEVKVKADGDGGGVVKISGGEGKFSWRLKLPEDAKVHLMSSSMENGVLTVVVPKLAMDLEWENRARDVRQIEISGSD